MPRRKQTEGEKKIDISQMAEDLGVSKTTVSRALSGNGRVSEATRARVVQYAKEKNYVPNMLARGLVTQQSYNISLVFSRQFGNLAAPFLRKTVSAVYDIATRNDYDVLMTMVGEQETSPMQRLLVNRKIDGVILARTLERDPLIPMLQKSGKPVVLCVNKCDSIGAPPLDFYEFYNLGLGDPIAVSAAHGHGTGDLLDAVVAALPEDSEAEGFEELPKFAIIGRPNVGKSSLTNALLDSERNIVTPVAGTTRDSILTRYNKFGMDFYLIDTAGLRKKTKVTEDLEFYSVLRSVRAIESSDVCILMLDASQGIESQDMNIFSLVVRNKKGCVIVVNKWDLIEKDNNTMKEFAEAIRYRLSPFSDVPIVFTSVPNKQRILEVLQTAMQVYYSRIRKIPTSQLNEYLLPIIEETPPPAIKGKYIRIKYVTQLASPTPSFAFFVNLPQYIKEGYRRFLENKIRERWDFTGVPLQIFFRQK